MAGNIPLSINSNIRGSAAAKTFLIKILPYQQVNFIYHF